MKKSFVIAFGFVLVFCSLASTTTWYIKDDGTGDAPTIQAGIDSAWAPDTVMLADGLYTGDGNRDIHVWGKEITIRSESDDPYACIINCEGTSSDWHAGFFLDAAESSGTVLEGFSIRGAYNGGGAAIYCLDSAPTIRHCNFDGNIAEGPGGAMSLFNSNPSVTDCVFYGNYSDDYGGAVSISYSTPTFLFCTFIANHGDLHGGAVYAFGGAPEFTSCMFIDNWAPWGGGMECVDGCSAVLSGCSFFSNAAGADGGGIRSSSSPLTVTNCTMIGDSTGSGGAGIHCASGVAPTLYATVVAFGIGGSGVHCGFAVDPPSLTCCIVYGNADGDWVGCLEGMDGSDGNLHLDPIFCDIAGFSVNVETCSPCIAENNGCGVRIGSGVAGCGCGEATEPTTWGNIKAMYR